MPQRQVARDAALGITRDGVFGLALVPGGFHPRSPAAVLARAAGRGHRPRAIGLTALRAQPLSPSSFFAHQPRLGWPALRCEEIEMTGAGGGEAAGAGACAGRRRERRRLADGRAPARRLPARRCTFSRGGGNSASAVGGGGEWLGSGGRSLGARCRVEIFARVLRMRFGRASPAESGASDPCGFAVTAAPVAAAAAAAAPAPAAGHRRSRRPGAASLARAPRRLRAACLLLGRAARRDLHARPRARQRSRARTAAPFVARLAAAPRPRPRRRRRRRRAARVRLRSRRFAGGSLARVGLGFFDRLFGLDFLARLGFVLARRAGAAICAGPRCASGAPRLPRVCTCSPRSMT